MTQIPTEGSAHSGTETILRWLWWSSIVVLVALLVGFAIVIYIGPSPYKSGDDIGYNMGLVGGLMMLSLLLYPLRKRVRLLNRLGAMRNWFRYHMVIGIAGPVLVLFHSTFRLGAMNSRVAFYAMILVAVSGVVGRFLYRHVHRGMYGQHLSMQDAEADFKARAEDLRTIFSSYPEIEQRLRAFREYAFTDIKGVQPRLHRFLTLRFTGRRLAYRVKERLKRAMRKAKHEQKMSRYERVLSYRLAKEKVEAYVDAVCKASQLSSWEHLFSMWHVIHIPFLYLLVVSGIVHVIAVHMY